MGVPGGKLPWLNARNAEPRRNSITAEAQFAWSVQKLATKLWIKRNGPKYLTRGRSAGPNLQNRLVIVCLLPESREFPRETSLPHYLQRELNVSRQRDQALQTSCIGRRSIRQEYLGITGAIKGQGRRKVGVVEDIEKLRPELHVEALRNLLHRKVLNQREIYVLERWTDDTVASSIAEKICARARKAGAKRPASGGDIRSCLGQLEATVIHVTEENPARTALVIVIHRIASGNKIRNGENVGADVLYSERVGSNEGSSRNPAIQLDNAAQLPSAYHRR